MSKKGSTTTGTRDRAADPWGQFVRVSARREGPSFYFERGPSPGRSARWAIYGFEPDSIFRLGGPSELAAFQDFLSRGGDPRKGISVGFAGFDAVGLFEPMLSAGAPGGSPFPLAEYHHYRNPTVVPLGARPRASVSPARLPETTIGPVQDSSAFPGFSRSVGRLRKAILEGEAFQVVLAHRRERRIDGSLLPMVDRLRRTERYAYLYYLRTDTAEIAGASPESVVEVRADHVAVSPIAGTRPLPPPPRGPEARLPLDRDPKELAEHRMLVDLARNDVGRVAEVGSVHLTRRETRVPYARLEHLVSRVVGRLAPGRTALDALAATFPAGTVSGAPKIRATQLLRREERTWRGPYAGAVGVLWGPREAEFALVIRSAFAARGKVYTAAGAGIVHLSEPAREWKESLTKLAAVEAALTGERSPPPGRAS